MNELESFLEELKNNLEIHGVILFGSYARGNARPNSDIDLIVVCNETKRGVEERNGQFFEVVYVTEEDAKAFYLDNKDNAVRTWKVAQILFDRDGTAERIKQFVAAIEKEGKQKLSGDKLILTRFDIEDSLRGIETNATINPTNTIYLMNIKLLSLLDLFFDVRGIWKPAPKQLLGEIQKQDQNLYHSVTSYYQEQNPQKRLTILKSIADTVLGA